MPSAGDPPGAGLAFRHVEPSGEELVVVARGDAFDFYSARGPEVACFSVEPRAAFRLAVFVLWRWWVRAALFGIRHRRWGRSLSASVSAGARGADAPRA